MKRVRISVGVLAAAMSLIFASAAFAGGPTFENIPRDYFGYKNGQPNPQVLYNNSPIEMDQLTVEVEKYRVQIWEIVITYKTPSFVTEKFTVSMQQLLNEYSTNAERLVHYDTNPRNPFPGAGYPARTLMFHPENYRGVSNKSYATFNFPSGAVEKVELFMESWTGNADATVYLSASQTNGPTPQPIEPVPPIEDERPNDDDRPLPPISDEDEEPENEAPICEYQEQKELMDKEEVCQEKNYSLGEDIQAWIDRIALERAEQTGDLADLNQCRDEFDIEDGKTMSFVNKVNANELVISGARAKKKAIRQRKRFIENLSTTYKCWARVGDAWTGRGNPIMHWGEAGTPGEALNIAITACRNSGNVECRARKGTWRNYSQKDNQYVPRVGCVAYHNDAVSNGSSYSTIEIRDRSRSPEMSR